MKKCKVCIIIIFFCAINSVCFSENIKIDSLLFLLKSDQSDTGKVNHLIDLCNEYRSFGAYDNSLKTGNDALNRTCIITDQNYKAAAYNSIGNTYYSMGNYPMALKNYLVSLKINEVLKNKKSIAGSYLNIGICYYYLSNYLEALKNYYASLNLREQIGDKEGIAIAYTNIGLVYDEPANYPEALKNYFAALKIYEGIENKQGIADSYINIGRVYYEQDNYSDALKMYSASLKIKEKIGEKYSVAFIYNVLGNIYWNQLNYVDGIKAGRFPKKINSVEYVNLLSKARINYLTALKIRTAIGDKQGVVESCISIGNVQIESNKLSEAQEYFNEALFISKGLGIKQLVKDSYDRLAVLDSMQGNWKAAYLHHKLFTVYRDSINNEESEKKSIQSVIVYNLEKKKIAIKTEEDKKNIIENANKKRKQQVIALVFCILILFFVLVGFTFRSKRLTKKIDTKEKTIL